MGLLAARPLASLSSGLLARKGQARPAMRAAGLVSFTDAGPLDGSGLDDLGWNDMGETAPAGLEPEPPVPAVLIEREALREEVETPPPAVTAPAVTAPAAEPMPVGKARAAFTLRLDAERHLRLRLASAAANRSAQRLMVDALDTMLAAMPQVEALARQAGATKA